MTKVDIREFIDKRFELFGALDNHFKLDGVVYEAVEDPQDDYRSCLDYVLRVEDPSGLPFRNLPICEVTGRQLSADSYGYNDGVEFVGDDGHVWLEVGTKNADDYYPMFWFRFQPKAP